MSNVDEMLKRQAQWQKSRQQLTWPEKIRMAEQVRDSVVALRSSAGQPSRSVRNPNARLVLGKVLGVARHK